MHSTFIDIPFDCDRPLTAICTNSSRSSLKCRSGCTPIPNHLVRLKYFAKFCFLSLHPHRWPHRTPGNPLRQKANNRIATSDTRTSLFYNRKRLHSSCCPSVFEWLQTLVTYGVETHIFQKPPKKKTKKTKTVAMASKKINKTEHDQVKYKLFSAPLFLWSFLPAWTVRLPKSVCLPISSFFIPLSSFVFRFPYLFSSSFVQFSYPLCWPIHESR